MEPKTIKNVFDKFTNIVGIKEASGSIDQLIEIKRLVKELQIFSGDDKLVLDVMVHGGSGLISVASNAFPLLMSEIVDRCLRGNFDEATDLYYDCGIPELIKALFCETNPIPIKYIMNSLAIYDNFLMRLPMTSLSADKYHFVDDSISKPIDFEKID